VFVPFLLAMFAARYSDGASLVESYDVIVHAGNPTDSLSRQQIAAYFLKRRAAWPAGHKVEPVDLPPESTTRKAFSNEVLGRSPSAISAYWIQEIFAGRSEPPPVKSTDQAVVLYVSSTPGAIGYVSRGLIHAGVHRISIVP
jgi:ABC-type phosphate transport system substrate-binding protein